MGIWDQQESRSARNPFRATFSLARPGILSGPHSRSLGPESLPGHTLARSARNPFRATLSLARPGILSGPHDFAESLPHSRMNDDRNRQQKVGQVRALRSRIDEAGRRPAASLSLSSVPACFPPSPFIGHECCVAKPLRRVGIRARHTVAPAKAGH